MASVVMASWCWNSSHTFINEESIIIPYVKQMHIRKTHYEGLRHYVGNSNYGIHVSFLISVLKVEVLAYNLHGVGKKCHPL